LGRKVHPIGFRLGITKNWLARWYAEGREYVELLHEDLKIRQFVKEQLKEAGIARIEIDVSPSRSTSTSTPPGPASSSGARAWGSSSCARPLRR
jgi:Ribosomal protein S3